MGSGSSAKKKYKEQEEAQKSDEDGTMSSMLREYAATEEVDFQTRGSNQSCASVEEEVTDEDGTVRKKKSRRKRKSVANKDKSFLFNEDGEGEAPPIAEDAAPPEKRSGSKMRGSMSMGATDDAALNELREAHERNQREAQAAGRRDAEVREGSKRTGSKPLQEGGRSIVDEQMMSRQGSKPQDGSRQGSKAQDGSRQVSNSSGFGEEPEGEADFGPKVSQRRASIRAHRLGVAEGLDPGSPTSPISPGAASFTSQTSGGSSGGSRHHGRHHDDPGSPGGHHRRHHDDKGDDPGSPHTPGGHHRHHGHGGRRGSTLGAESLAVLHKVHEDELHKHDADEEMLGFHVGDKVTPHGGPDAHGPWAGLGSGQVEGPAPKRGFLKVLFEKSGDTYALKAANLTNLTDASRSGSHVRTTTETYCLKKRAGVLSAVDTDVQNYHSDPMGGLKPGDHVGIGAGGEGVVVKAGAQVGTILVRFGDLGIRSFAVKELTKKKCVLDRDSEAQKAQQVQTGRRRFTLSVAEASGGFKEEDIKIDKNQGKEPLSPTSPKSAKSKNKASSASSGAAGGGGDDEEEKPPDPMMGLKVGDYVEVDANDGNPMWHDIGIGLIRDDDVATGVEGAVRVQFESGGDSFVMKVTQLKRVAAPERRFRKLGQQAIPESQEGKQRRASIRAAQE